MNLRKVLCNSNEELWDILSLVFTFGIVIVIFTSVLIVFSIEDIFLRIISALVAVIFDMLYLFLTVNIGNLGSHHFKRCLFRKGDIVSHFDGEPFLVTRADTQHMWVSSDLKNGTCDWITSPNYWTFYKSTWFERLLQKKHDNFC